MKLTTIQQGLYASSQYLAQRKAPDGPQDLDDHDIIAMSDDAAEFLKRGNQILSSGQKETSARRRPIMTVNTVLCAMRAAEAGMGIAVIPAYLGDNSRHLVRLPLLGLDTDLDLFFVYPEELRGSKRIVAFRDFLLSTLKRGDEIAGAILPLSSEVSS